MTKIMRHYHVLGISPNSSLEEIRKAYKRLTIKYHPDKVQGKNKKVALEKFKEFQIAYQTLKSYSNGSLILDNSTNKPKTSKQTKMDQSICSNSKSFQNDFYSGLGNNNDWNFHWFYLSQNQKKTLKKTKPKTKPKPKTKTKTKTKSKKQQEKKQRKSKPKIIETRSAQTKKQQQTSSPTNEFSTTPTSDCLDFVDEQDFDFNRQLDQTQKSKMKKTVNNNNHNNQNNKSTSVNNSKTVNEHTNKLLPKLATTKKKILVSLNHVFLGVEKLYSFHRKIFDRNGKLIGRKTVKVRIKIPPGVEDGDTILFSNRGNRQEGHRCADLQITVFVQKHPLFKRQGADLHLGHSISLKQSLSKFSLTLIDLNSSKFVISFGEDGSTIKNGETFRVSGLGLPKKNIDSFNSKENKKGDLVIRFNIQKPQN
ncbi:DNAj domain containing protein [Anaeramoeba flamelloides]|uniref:DNAj domain containing protein n=1 Tax=Anaeramoeba flamelloides TaxID=1746091 RepID=A0ABQ8X7T6_9EUKA|nr:DNAj domain containing protein [Anaeramoeba flamelloides]